MSTTEAIAGTTTTVRVETNRPLLPPEFADLEPWARVWVFDGADARMKQRLASTMHELQAFYDAAFPRAETAMEHLAAFDLDDLPDAEINLMRLLYALSAVTMSVEIHKQPRVPDSGSTYLDWVEEPRV